jgi:carbonic anhydrase/acetyltransferase-like protein (isoleucine patch superfamily)
VFVEGDVVIGDRVTVKSGVQLWSGVELEDEVFVGPNATFTNDRFPRSKDYQAILPRTLVKNGASVGANATVIAGVIIGSHAMIGAGAVVTSDVPSNAIVVGNPARISGYVAVAARRALEPLQAAVAREQLRVRGARVVELTLQSDLRGSVSVGEFDRHLPFLPHRYFVIFDVPSKEVRGEHAHRTLEQFRVCLRGTCSLVLDDGQEREEIALSTPRVGVYIPPMVWLRQYRHSADAVVLVLASAAYDPGDYVRDYDEFVRLTTGGG